MVNEAPIFSLIWTHCDIFAARPFAATQLHSRCDPAQLWAATSEPVRRLVELGLTNEGEIGQSNWIRRDGCAMPSSLRRIVRAVALAMYASSYVHLLTGAIAARWPGSAQRRSG